MWVAVTVTGAGAVTEAVAAGPVDPTSCRYAAPRRERRARSTRRGLSIPKMLIGDSLMASWISRASFAFNGILCGLRALGSLVLAYTLELFTNDPTNNRLDLHRSLGRNRS